MKKFLIMLMVIGMACSFIGCNEKDKDRAAMKIAKIAAMEYGYGARDWFEWGKDEQLAYELIMTGNINETLITAIEVYVNEKFKNPVAAQGVIELIDEACLQFDAEGQLEIAVNNQYSVKFLQSIAEGFYLGVTAK